MKTLSQSVDEILRIPCAHCGKRIYADGKQGFYRGEKFQPFDPLFCSVECIDAHDPTNFDAALLDTLMAWMPAITPEKSARAIEGEK